MVSPIDVNARSEPYWDKSKYPRLTAPVFSAANSASLDASYSNTSFDKGLLCPPYKGLGTSVQARLETALCSLNGPSTTVKKVGSVATFPRYVISFVMLFGYLFHACSG